MWLTVGDLMIRAFGLTNFEKFILSIRDDFLDAKRGPVHSASCSIPCLKIEILINE